MPACPPSPAHPGLPEQSRRKPGRAGYSYSSTCTPVLYRYSYSCTSTVLYILYSCISCTVPGTVLLYSTTVQHSTVYTGWLQTTLLFLTILTLGVPPGQNAWSVAIDPRIICFLLAYCCQFCFVLHQGGVFQGLTVGRLAIPPFRHVRPVGAL